MLQQETPEDYVIATGETHTVREFVEVSFNELDIAIEWEGEAANEKGRNAATGEVIVEVSPRYYRPTEVDLLLGDPSKAKRQLGWAPTVTFEELARMMARADYEKVQKRGY